MEEILSRLGYEKCGCPPDYRAAIKIVNLTCPNHPYNKLTIDGIRFDEYRKERDLDKVDTK